MQSQRQIVEIKASVTKPRRFVFVLLENFTLLSFASALECLRISNRMANKTLYDWILLGEDGAHITCSAGIIFQVDTITVVNLISRCLISKNIIIER